MIPFIKMHGSGNDFVVLDARKQEVLPLNWAKLADRHQGIGCDQVVILEHSERADVRMRIINADGSEAASCGNASRCVGWLLHHEKPGKLVTIETLAGVIEAHVNGGSVTVDMGKPHFLWNEIPLSHEMDTLHMGALTEGVLHDPVGVSIGNPHAVFFVDNVENIPLAELGPKLEHNPLFPQRANIGVAQIISASEIRLRVWERGAGLTLACGTGACAALVAAHRRGLTGRKAAVHLPGGILVIEWRPKDDHVLMSGEVATSFQGSFSAGSMAR